MKNILIITALLVLTACGKDQYTWGDASQEISDAYCVALYTCGYAMVNTDTDPNGTEWMRECAAHTKFHLCELNESCGDKLATNAEDVVNTCVTALDGPTFHDGNSDDCYFLGFWSEVPAVCQTALELNPHPSM